HFVDDRPAYRLVVFDGEHTSLLNLRNDADTDDPAAVFAQQNGSAGINGRTVLEGVHATVVPSSGDPYRLPGITAYAGPRAGTFWVIRQLGNGPVWQAAVTDL